MRADLLHPQRQIDRPEYFVLEGTEEENDQEILEEFVKQFYSQAAFVPQKVLLPTELEEAQIINTWLNSRKSGDKVEITVPHQEVNQSLIDMATENAVETLNALKSRWESDKHRQTGALTELQEALGLSEPPNRIECYDISTTQGVASVGSMVVFEQGTPNKKLYRRFNIKTVLGQDDFASMEEVLFRRFRRWKAQAEEKGQVGKKPDLAFSILPDLLLVDGGKGQLSRAVKVLEEYNLLDRVPVAGLAKQEEELFLPEKHNSIFLERHSAGLISSSASGMKHTALPSQPIANVVRSKAWLPAWMSSRGSAPTADANYCRNLALLRVSGRLLRKRSPKSKASLWKWPNPSKYNWNDVNYEQ